jgi:hypothetical protein
MCPASLFAPQTSEFITHGIIRSFGQTAMLAFAKFVVALCDLPDCRALLAVVSKSIKLLWPSKHTMCINRDSFSPAKAHKAYAVCNFGSNALQSEQLSVGSAVTISTPGQHFAGVKSFHTNDWAFWIS